MISQFAGASIWSADLNNLLPFYRDVLGVKVTMESPGYVVLGGGAVGAPGLALGTHSDVRGGNPEPARHMVAFTSDDLPGDWQRLKAAGVEFIQDPTAYEHLSVATLKDPEGNLVQLLQYQ